MKGVSSGPLSPTNHRVNNIRRTARALNKIECAEWANKTAQFVGGNVLDQRLSGHYALYGMGRYHRGAMCPSCESEDTRPSHRTNFSERAMSWIGIRPFRCRECRTRFWQIRGRVWDGTLLSLLLILIETWNDC